jgi:streptomycin 6-kinase
VRADGSRVVLKVGLPHMESAHEADALRLWDGDPTVRLLESDSDRNAMLLERCEPGTALRERPELEQDVVMAGLLHRLWRRPPAPHGFLPLAVMIAHWAAETMAVAPVWPDPGLVRAGLRLLEELARPASDDVLLATDLHAGNVLRAQRRPWLVIDPKPFVGDRAYDATQHLFNCGERLLTAPDGTIRRFAELLEVEVERVRLWMFARAAAEPRDAWDGESLALARALG